jgi:hypothetical protein
VTVTGSDDDLVDGDISFLVIAGDATSDDSNYAGVDENDVSVTTEDGGFLCE